MKKIFGAFSFVFLISHGDAMLQNSRAFVNASSFYSAFPAAFSTFSPKEIGVRNFSAFKKDLWKDIGYGVLGIAGIGVGLCIDSSPLVAGGLSTLLYEVSNLGNSNETI